MGDEEASWLKGETQYTQLKTFSLRYKNIVSQPAGLCSFFEGIRFLTKGNSNKIQNLTLNRSNSIAIDNVLLLLNKVNVFGTGVTLPGRADPNQTATGPC